MARGGGVVHTYNTETGIFNLLFYLSNQFDISQRVRIDSKLMTDTAWNLLARIILSSSFHCLLIGSNSRISLVGEWEPTPKPLPPIYML